MWLGITHACNSPGRHARRFEEAGRTILAEGDTAAEAARADFYVGSASDLRACDWSTADVIFINSTCFDDALMHAIADQAAALKLGAFVITFTRRLPSEQFDVLEEECLTMSWGGATVFIQRKKTLPAPR